MSIKMPRYLVYSFCLSCSWSSIKISNLVWGLLPTLNNNKFDFDLFRLSLLALSQLVTLFRAIVGSVVSRVELIYCYVNERYIYHQQRDDNSWYVMRHKCCLYVGEIVRTQEHSPVVLHMLQFVGLRYIWPFEFCQIRSW